MSLLDLPKTIGVSIVTAVIVLVVLSGFVGTIPWN